MHSQLPPATRRLGLFFLSIAIGCLLVPASPDRSLGLVQSLGVKVQAAKRPHPRLQEAKTLIEEQRADEAIPILQSFITSSPSPRYLDQAYLLLAAALIRTDAQEEAITYLDQLLEEFPDSKLANRARLLQGSAHAELGQLDLALPLLAEVRSLAKDTETRREALTLTGDLLTRKGDYLRAIQAWKEEISLAPEDLRAAPHERIRHVVMEKLDMSSLRRLRASYPGEFPADLATIRLIEIHIARREQHAAEKLIKLFLRRFPSHEYASTARGVLDSFSAELKQSEYVITALLPLSGRLNRFGTDALRGIQLALDRAREIYDIPSIGLAVKDTQADRAFLKSEVYELVDGLRPIAIIGPMRSREVRRLAELVERTETPLVTPSATLLDVRQLGQYLFSTAMTYSLQVKRIVDYAMSQRKYYRFCILYPDTFYGRELARLFAQEVRQRAGGIIAVDSYKEEDNDFGLQIRRLKEQDLQGDGTITEVSTSKGEERTQYNPGFDAVFVPGNAREVALISAQLLFYDIKVPLLGTNGWNSPELLRLADASLEGSVFVDGFHVESPDATIQDFVQSYRGRYETNPSIFAAQAYDAAQLIVDAVRRGARSARDVANRLRQTQDLPVLGGRTGFNSRGVLNRRLFLLQVQENKIVPAPLENGESSALPERQQGIFQ